MLVGHGQDTTLTAGPRRRTQGASRIEVGRFTYGHHRMAVREWGEGASLTIGAFCSIADGLTVMLGGNHRTDWVTTFPFGHIFEGELGGGGIVGHPVTNGDVRIGNDVWIGANATIMSGIRIGNGAVIAANSTVVKDVGPYEVWGGNPARRIRQRFPDEVIAALEELKWWDWDVAVVRALAPQLSQAPDLDHVRALAAQAEALKSRPEPVRREARWLSRLLDRLDRFRFSALRR
ncbi:MAG: hypothetical protein RIR62_2927 [Pseudomonadota bacterium]